jgi:flavin reductase (DIM6/NTAB) family NADH-FMN oxidoreductase RutF
MKRPWNIPDLQVYSLVTYDRNRLNMNICTYVSAMSLKPKIFAIGIYQGTQTLHNIQNGKTAVLQVLTTEHTHMVRTLGKKSGKNFDKDSWLRNNTKLEKWKGFEVLPGCAGLMKLEKESFLTTGDHDLYIFGLVHFSSPKIKSKLLTTRILSENQIIRI